MSRSAVVWLAALILISSIQLLAAEPAPGDALIAEYFRLRTSELASRTDRFLSGIRSVAEWESHKPRLRQQLFSMLGLDPLPAKGDLQPVITGQIQHEEFAVEKLHFQSSPGLYVTANFYLPKNATGPLPTVLYVCGHSQNKKDGVSFGNKVGYQHHGAWYARNGYACLTIDTLQLGEIEGLHHGTYKEGMWWWHSRGYTPAGAEAWNCIRALDYLETRPEVDKQRIGVTGRSGGGAYSWYIAAIDERIQVAVPVAGITTLKNHIVDGCIEGHCDCMFQVNSEGWDYGMLAALVAPRPLLIANTDKDTIFPLDGVVEVHRQVRHIYELYGKPAQLGLNITEGPHKDTQELQVHEFVWFNRFLKQAEAPIEKVAVKFFEPAQLRVFEKLPEDQRNTRIQEEFVPTSKLEVPKSQAELDARWQDWLGRPRTKTSADSILLPLDVSWDQKVARRGIDWTEYRCQCEKPYRLSLWFASPSGLDVTHAKRVVIHVLDQTEWERVHELMEMARSEAEFKLTAEKGAEFIAFQNMCREPDAVQVFFAPRGVGPTEWSRDERQRSHILRRFALLGETADDARVRDLIRATRAIQTLVSDGETEKSLTWSGARDAASWILRAVVLQDHMGDHLQLTDLPADDRNGPVYLNLSRTSGVQQLVALALARNAVTLRMTQAVPAEAWEFSRQVDALLGKREGLGLTILTP